MVLSSINIVVPSCDSVEEELNKKPGKADSLSVADGKAIETCVETGLDPCDHPVLPPLNFPHSLGGERAKFGYRHDRPKHCKFIRPKHGGSSDNE